MKKKVSIQALFLIVCIFVSYSTLSFKYIRSGALNADEGFYLLAAKKVMEGEVPYRDFAYSQLPVLPYLNGVMMKIAGYGFLEQRAVNAFWGMLSLCVLLLVGFMDNRPWPFLWGALIVSISPHLIYFLCLGKTYAAASFFMVVTISGIYLQLRYPLKVILASLGGVLAIGCRLPVAPVVLILWSILIFQGHTIKERSAACAWILILCLILFLPFYLAAPENFIFWNLEYHLGSSFDRRGWASIYEHLVLSPACMFVIILSAGYLVLNYRTYALHEVGIFISALIGIIVQLVLKSSYGENSVPFIAIAAVSAIVILNRAQWFKYILIFILISPILYLNVRLPDTSEGLVDNIYESASFIKKNVRQDGKILTPLPLIAVQAGYEVIRGSEMGKFGLTAEMDVERARRLGLIPYADLLELVERKNPEALVFNSFSSRWNFYWSVPSLRAIPKDLADRFHSILLQNYYFAYKNDEFAVLLKK